MFKVFPASLQTFVDTPNCVLEDRAQYSTVHITNVSCDGHLQITNCVNCNRQVNRDFLIALYYNLTGPLSYMRSVVDRNVVMLRITAFMCSIWISVQTAIISLYSISS